MNYQPKGYAGLARLMAKGVTPTFRAFAELNLRSLMALQSELHGLEERLNMNTTVQQLLNPSSDKRADLLNEEKDLLLEIREKLNEYNTSLLHIQELHRFSRTSNHDFKLVQRCIFHMEFFQRDDKEVRPWLNSVKHDLVSLSWRSDLDTFTVFIVEKIIPWLVVRIRHRVKKLFGIRLFELDDAEHSGVHILNEPLFQTVSRILSVVLLTSMSSLAVLALYLIPNLGWRLGASIGFSFLIAVALAFFTSAKPVEVFAVTSACASVLIVFVGSTSVIGI